MNISLSLTHSRETFMSKVITGIVLALVAVSSTVANAQSGDSSLRVGYRSDAAPFAFTDSSGNPAGYSVELCQQVVQDMQAKGRLTVEYIPLSAAQRGTALQNGRVDLLCGADTVTLGRREQFSFSMPIFVGGIGAALRTDAPSRLRALMAGEEPAYRPRWRASFGQILRQRTFAVVGQSMAQEWLAGSIDDLGIIAETTVVNNYDEGIAQVASGDVDVLFGDRAILLDAATSERDIYVVDRRFTDEAIALAMRRGDDALRLSVDRSLSALYRSGEIYDIYERYFGEAGDETRLLFRLAALPE